MATAKLTMREVLKLRRDAEGTPTGLYLWDTELRGFGCRASPSGEISWLFQHWVGGKGGMPKRLVFDHYPPMLIDDARKEAENLRGAVNKGEDILNRKVKRRQEQREQLQSSKLQDALARYLNEKRKPGRYWDELERTFRREVLPLLGGEHVNKIAKEQLRALIKQKQDKGHHGAARTLFAALNPFFKWCVEEDIITRSPLEGLKAKPKPVDARDRALHENEIKSLWDATFLDTLFGPFYRLLLLTGQRRDEVSGMQWKELNLDRATWLIPKERTKNDREHLVHLSPQTISIINSIPQVDSPFVLNSTLGTKLTGYSKAKQKIDRLTNLDTPWRVHDLRRTFITISNEQGLAAPHVIEAAVNHISGSAKAGVAGVYNRALYLEERKRLFIAWGNYVDKLVSEKPLTDNVVPLRASLSAI